MLFSRRKRLEALAAAETEGRLLWTSEFDGPSRIKLAYAFRDAAATCRAEDVGRVARELVLRDEGLFFLQDPYAGEVDDLLSALVRWDSERVPTLIEGIAAALTAAEWSPSLWNASADFQAKVRTVLREHRVSFDLVEGRMIEFSSREMHEAVVVPVLRLLAGRSELDGAESAYQDGLEEITKGKAGDAITDAGTALQETLVALGCKGNALSPLIRDAKARNLLAAHDVTLTDGIEKMLHWASADRSQTGDSHGARSPAVPDAWLTLHVVGALLLRLVEPVARGG